MGFPWGIPPILRQECPSRIGPNLEPEVRLRETALGDCSRMGQNPPVLRTGWGLMQVIYKPANFSSPQRPPVNQPQQQPSKPAANNNGAKPVAAPVDADGAMRWNQVQELLLGEHKRSVDSRLQDVAARLISESERLSGLLVSMEKRHREVEADLRKENEARKLREEQLTAEITSMRASHMDRSGLAEQFRKLANKVDPGAA